MPKKKRTPAQLAADKARSEKMKANIIVNVGDVPEHKIEPQVEEIAGELTLAELEAQVKLLTSLFAGGVQNVPGSSVGVDRGKLVGEVEKYVVDPANYEDPTPRLALESRLKAVNFDFDYELTYEVAVTSYETKTGINMREPKFTIQLNRIVVNDQGEQTDKRYIARRLIFHEDPQAAIIVARENGLEVDENNQKEFLNEMRYLRVRDWLFGIFWPKPAQLKDQIREEVIGGTIVQVFTKNSDEPEGLDFDKISTVIRA